MYFWGAALAAGFPPAAFLADLATCIVRYADGSRGEEQERGLAIRPGAYPETPLLASGKSWSLTVGAMMDVGSADNVRKVLWVLCNNDAHEVMGRRYQRLAGAGYV